MNGHPQQASANNRAWPKVMDNFGLVLQMLSYPLRLRAEAHIHPGIVVQETKDLVEVQHGEVEGLQYTLKEVSMFDFLLF